MDSDHQSSHVTTGTRRITAASRRTEGHIYRPGPFLAAVMLLLPAALALTSAAVALVFLGTIPPLVPLLLLLWIPALIAAWLAAVSVRTTATTIAAGRPGRYWRELPWALVDRAERRGPYLLLKTSDGRRVIFVPALLEGGDRLYREILMRLSLRVLDNRLRMDVRVVLGEQVALRGKGDLSGTLYARPRALWRWGAASISLAVLALAGASYTSLPIVMALLITGACLAALIVTVAAFLWLSQNLVISEHGMTVLYPLARRSRDLAWDEIQLIEHTHGELILRLWGKRRVRCAGPSLLDDTKRDLMRAYLHEYCLAKGVPVVERRWLW